MIFIDLWGYAVVGLFDEYLAKQNELGSVADTHAKIQLEAVSALQPKQPKVLDCLHL